MDLKPLDCDYIENYSDGDILYKDHSLEDRKEFFKLNTLKIMGCDNPKVYKTLFSEEEALKLYSENKSCIYIYMSKEDRIKHLEDLNSLDFAYLTDYIFDNCSFSDVENKEKVLHKCLNSLDLNVCSVAKIYKSFGMELGYKECEKYALVFEVVDLESFFDLVNVVKKEDIRYVVKDVLKEKIKFDTKKLEFFLGKMDKDKRDIFIDSLIEENNSLSLYGNYDVLIKHSSLENRLKFISKLMNKKRFPIYGDKLLNNMLDGMNSDMLDIFYNMYLSYSEKLGKSNDVFVLSSVILLSENKEYFFNKYGKGIEKNVIKYLKEKESYKESFELLNNYIDKSNTSVQDVLSLFTNINEKALKDEKKYPCIKNYLIEKLGLNKDNFNKLVDRLGCVCFGYLANTNFIKVINLDKDNFDKYLNIYSEDNCKLDDSSFNSLRNALLNRMFTCSHPSVVHAFSDFQNKIHNKDYNGILSSFVSIAKEYGISIDDFISQHDYKLERFVNDLIDGKKEAIDLLHDFTNSYIAQRREFYVNNERDAFDKGTMFIEYYDKTFVKKELFRQCKTMLVVKLLENYKDYNGFSEEEKNLLNDKALLWKVVRSKQMMINNKGDIGNENRYLIKYFHLLDSIVDVIYSKGHFLTLYEYFKEPIKVVRVPRKVERSSICDLIGNIDIDCVKDKLLNDDKLYKIFLNDYVKKYKFLAWKNQFRHNFSMVSCTFDKTTIKSIFENFYKVYPKVKDQSVTKFIDYSNCYCSVSKKYSLLLGEENADYLLLDPGPYVSSFSREDKLKEVEKLIVDVYQREDVTIPPLCDVVEIYNGRKISVRVGNFTDPIVFTYGERTKSCLRIGGAYKNLFNFCLENKNGFHIEFSDPKNGEFISKISGIRNGNTLFLNQLRYVVDESKYTNYELVCALKEFVNEIVEESKKSGSPIENVLISSEYAMNGYGFIASGVEVLDSTNSTYGMCMDLYPGNCYMLYSEYSDGEYQFKLKEKDSVDYDVLRNKVVCVENSKDLSPLVRLQMINLLFCGVSVEKMDLDEIEKEIRKEDFVRYYYGDDFYVLVNSNGALKKFVVCDCDKRAKEDIEKVKKIEKIKNKL